MKMIAFILLSAAFVPAAFAASSSRPADNASEIVPPHRATGYTYAKGDPGYRMLHGTDWSVVRSNELSAGEYNPCPECASVCNDCNANVETSYEVRYDDDSVDFHGDHRDRRHHHHYDRDGRIHRDYR